MSTIQIEVSVLKTLNEVVDRLVQLVRAGIQETPADELSVHQKFLQNACDQVDGSVEVTRYMVEVKERIGQSMTKMKPRQIPAGVKLVRGDQRPLTPDQAAARRKERMARLEEEAKKKREITEPENPVSPDA